MAQYAYYKIGNTNTQIKRVGWKVGNNTSTFRKVGWNNSVYILESWRSCSANVPVTYRYYTQGKSIPTANHSYTLISSWESSYYYGNIVHHSGTSYCWDVNWFSTYDSENVMHVENAYTFVTNGMTYTNGLYRSISDGYTFEVKSYENGTKNVQTSVSHTVETPVHGGNFQQKAEFKYEQSTIPNQGHINNSLIIDKYNLYPVIDNVNHLTTSYFLPSETPFVWNTW